MFVVVDVWPILRSERPYRPGWSDTQVYDYLREQAGKQFDPQVEGFFQLYQSDFDLPPLFAPPLGGGHPFRMPGSTRWDIRRRVSSAAAKYRAAEGEPHGVLHDCVPRVHDMHIRKGLVETVLYQFDLNIPHTLKSPVWCVGGRMARPCRRVASKRYYSINRPPSASCVGFGGMVQFKRKQAMGHPDRSWSGCFM